jgi:exodeoxyribonuclease-3
VFSNLRVVSVYFPSGASGDHRQQKKWDFLNNYRQMLLRQIKSHQPSVVCGDVNIVHKAIDIENFKSNQKTSGCLPEERAWLDRVFEDIGWVDGFRVINQNPYEYTWWSYRGQARAKNVGWRIDYQMVTPYLASLIDDGFVYRKQHFSDHAPVVIDYDFTPQTGQNQ